MISRSTFVAEVLGTGLLLAVIVGSGWAVQQLGAAPATQLFVHAVIVGAGLAVAIIVFIPLSGAQFNPAVTLALLIRRQLDAAAAAQIVGAQFMGGVFGLILANFTFASELMSMSSIDRIGAGRIAGEVFATFGLVLVILALIDTRRESAIPAAVGLWVTTIIVGGDRLNRVRQPGRDGLTGIHRQLHRHRARIRGAVRHRSAARIAAGGRCSSSIDPR